MTKKIQIFTFSIFFIISPIVFVGCINGALLWADNSVTQTSGIDVSVKENSKKQFILGSDTDELVAMYSQYGELTTLNVKVSGNVTKDKLKDSTTGMYIDEKGNPQVCKNQNESEYFTDWIKIKVYMPKDAYYVCFDDNKEDIEIDKPTMTEDTYLKKNFEWIKVNKEKTTFQLVTNQSSNEYYGYVAFKDKDKNVLEQYFIHIIYDIEIK